MNGNTTGFHPEFLMWELANMEIIEVINQVWDTVFHHQMKHWEESWKYDCSRVFLTNFEVFPVSNAWYYFSNKMILEGEIKDAKMSSQGCALVEPSGPWRLTFVIGQLENLRFFIQIICWAR